MLVSGTADELKLTNMAQYQELGIIFQAQEGMEHFLFLVSLTKCMFYEDMFLFISFENGTIAVLSVTDWESLKELKTGKKRIPVTDFAIHPSGRISIALCRKKAAAILFDLTKGRRIIKTKLQLDPLSIGFSPRGTKYAILGQKGLECHVNIHTLCPTTEGSRSGSDVTPSPQLSFVSSSTHEEYPESNDTSKVDANLSTAAIKQVIHNDTSTTIEKKSSTETIISSRRKITAVEFLSEDIIAIAEYPNMLSIYSIIADRLVHMVSPPEALTYYVSTLTS